MKYNITIKKEYKCEFGWNYIGYVNGVYLDGALSLTKFGCKREVKKILNKKHNKVVEQYELEIGE